MQVHFLFLALDGKVSIPKMGLFGWIVVYIAITFLTYVCSSSYQRQIKSYLTTSFCKTFSDMKVCLYTGVQKRVSKNVEGNNYVHFFAFCIFAFCAAIFC